MTTELTGHVALITGAAMGMGRAAALALAEDGADIVGLDIAVTTDQPGNDLASLKSEVEALGRRALIFAGDVRDADAIQVAVDETIATFGRIDILFNNAGVVDFAPVDSITDDAWNRMIDINLKGPFLVARAIFPHMKARESGVVINNSSVAGLKGLNYLSHYAASKHGLVGLTRSWAIELAPFGIRVVSIHPGGVATPMVEAAAAQQGITVEEMAAQNTDHLLPSVPMIDANDIANLVRFLASDSARAITGAQIVIDAGMLTA